MEEFQNDVTVPARALLIVDETGGATLQKQKK